MKLQQSISKRAKQRWVGREVTILAEGESEETPMLWEGRTQFHAPEIDGKVYINDFGTLETLQAGQFLSCRDHRGARIRCCGADCVGFALNCFSMDDLGYLKSPRALAPILARTTELNFNMASDPRTGAMLQMLAASKPCGRLLELGTGTGIGTAWLLSGMDAASTLISVDTDHQVQAVAREALCHDTRLKLLSHDGAAFLWRQPKKSFDLVFADAIPGKYEALDEALAIVKPGGYYVIDDMLPQPNWPEGHGDRAQALLDRLATDPRFVMLPLVWSTGVVVLVRKSPQEVVPE